MQRRIHLNHLNPFLTCTLCTGYLVNATTIVECLHSFCRSCIIRHLEASYNCPKCNTEIHKTKPFEYIRSDPSLQEVVYKLVPDLYQKEAVRKETWEVTNNINRDDEDKDENSRILVTLKYFRGTSRMERIKTERVLKMFPTRYLCCQPEMPIRVLKKFVQYKFDVSMDLFTMEFWRGDETLLDDLTLKQLVQIFGLFRERKPLELHYSFFPKFKMEEEKPAPIIPVPTTKLPSFPPQDEEIRDNEEKTDSPKQQEQIENNTDTSDIPDNQTAEQQPAIPMDTDTGQVEGDCDEKG